METYISTLLTSLLSLYLPIAETGTRVAVSVALAQIITHILVKLYQQVTCATSLMDLIWKEQQIIISPENQTYWKIIEYLYESYNKMTKSCKLETDFGKNKMIIAQLSQRSLEDKYIYEGKEYLIKIRFEETHNQPDQNNKKNSKKMTDGKNMIICSVCSIKILETYLNDLIRRCNEKTASGIYVYKLSVDDHKNRVITWRGRNIKISKNLTNTIVSDEVDKNFYKDVDQFIGAEKAYLGQGLPYKRGYILHGPPGCGKTSLIKAIGNEYQLPIFILDLSILESNHELTKAVNNINSFVAYDQKHLLIMEDVDRTKVFKKSRYYDDDYSDRIKKITEDCILNILDGIDENYGRITIMTTNKLDVLENIDALMRPGRIDKVIEVTFCSKSQIIGIIKFFFGNDIVEMNLEDSIKITPAKLVHLIQYLGNCEIVFKIMNKIKDFTTVDVNKMELVEKHLADLDKGDLNIKEDLKDGANDENEDANAEELRWERRIKRRIHIYKRKKLLYDMDAQNKDKLGELALLKLEKRRINLILLENSIKNLQQRQKVIKTDFQPNKNEITGLVPIAPIQVPKFEIPVEDTQGSESPKTKTEKMIETVSEELAEDCDFLVEEQEDQIE